METISCVEEEELVTQQLIEEESKEPVHRKAEGDDDLNMLALIASEADESENE
jgi:hypothetical protein